MEKQKRSAEGINLRAQGHLLGTGICPQLLRCPGHLAKPGPQGPQSAPEGGGWASSASPLDLLGCQEVAPQLRWHRFCPDVTLPLPAFHRQAPLDGEAQSLHQAAEGTHEESRVEARQEWATTCLSQGFGPVASGAVDSWKQSLSEWLTVLPRLNVSCLPSPALGPFCWSTPPSPTTLFLCPGGCW